MANDIKLLTVVALTVDLPEYNLWRGQVGTVVDILADGQAFEVEFCDREGRTYESLGLRPEQFMRCASYLSAPTGSFDNVLHKRLSSLVDKYIPRRKYAPEHQRP